MEQDNNLNVYRGFELLVPNHSGAFVPKDGKPIYNPIAINYGVIRIENETLVYWTNKAMLEMRFDGTIGYKDEKYLIENGYIATIKLTDISRVLF